MTISLTQQGDDVLIPLKVVPNASRDRLMGELDGALKVSVAAAPERGAANKAVCKLLARALEVRPQQVKVIAGLTAPHKTLRVQGMAASDVRQRLGNS